MLQVQGNPRSLHARSLRAQAGRVVVLGLLALGLTGCYTQLQMADSERTSPRAAQSGGEGEERRVERIDPDNPVRSLRRANPDSRDDLVSLAKGLQEARADTEISYGEYREGVHFFRSNYPSFYGNYFGDPFYATYDVQYHTTARDAWRAGLDVNPHRGFRDGTAFLCAPHGYDPAFGCRSWAYAPSDFFILPDVFAFSSLAGTRSLSGGLSYGYGGRLGFASHGLFGFGNPYGYGSSGYGGAYGPTGSLASAASVDISDGTAENRREPEPRRETLGRGASNADPGGGADRATNADGRAEQARSAEGRDRERPAPAGRSGAGDRDRSEDDTEAPDVRGDAIRWPQMPIAPVFGGSAGEAEALAEVEHTTLETVRVSPPPLNRQNQTETLRTYRALQRIAESTDGRTVSVEHQEEMSAIVRHLQRTNTYRTEDRADRHRGRRIDRRDHGARRMSGRSSSGRSSSGGDRVRSTGDRGSSASGRSRSGRDSGGDSGRDRSRSRSDDSGGR